MLPMISRCTICCLCFLGSGIWKMLRWSLFFGVWHMEDAKMYDLLSLFFGVWHMEDAKMYDLLSLFFGVCHMEDAKMYDLLSPFFWGLAYE